MSNSWLVSINLTLELGLNKIGLSFFWPEQKLNKKKKKKNLDSTRTFSSKLNEPSSASQIDFSRLYVTTCYLKYSLVIRHNRITKNLISQIIICHIGCHVGYRL